MTIAMTQKQIERQRYRKSGRYANVNPCYRCGKSAGVDYLSDKRTDALINDEALCLCRPCYDLLDSMTDDQLLKEIARENYGFLPQGKASD